MMGRLRVAHHSGLSHGLAMTGTLRRILAILILSFLTTVRADEPAPVRLSLGGPRKVEATIAENGESVDITVRMIGVRCFDTATNKRLNREKGQLYAMHALARHLGIKHTMTVKGVTVGHSHTEGNTYFLTVKLPKGGIAVATTVQQETRPKQENEDTIDLDTFRGLLTVKDDYIATTQDLSSSLVADLPPTPADMSRKNDSSSKFG